jgi:hypothetical protein
VEYDISLGKLKRSDISFGVKKTTYMSRVGCMARTDIRWVNFSPQVDMEILHELENKAKLEFYTA